MKRGVKRRVKRYNGFFKKKKKQISYSVELITTLCFTGYTILVKNNGRTYSPLAFKFRTSDHVCLT